ncbi:MAG: helix-turn-helix transcriptional regulator [Parvibaculaceae bacterium]|nr:helix-turn-helix transcriptional regulator [Parvibaculaceae bacterium]
MRRPIETLSDIDDAAQPTVLAVSRQRLARPVTIRWHRHARGQILMVSTGLLTVQTQQGDWVVPGGHIFWIPPEQDHSLRLCGDFSGFYVYIEQSACAALPRKFGTAATPALLREAISRIATWTERPDPGSPEARIEAIVIDEVAALPLEREYLPMPAHPGIMQIARRIMTNPAEGQSLEALASDVGLSRRTITRRFVQETGLTFSTWKQRMRLLQAVEMLASDVPVTTIALDLGYDSPSAFTAMFRKHFGVTPSRFIKHQGNVPGS